MKNVGILKFFMALVIACLFMTCDPGLGKAVDTQAPKVEVKYPATKSVLKGGFTMTGVASDEVNVASCVVTFKNIKTSQEYNYNASVEKDEFKVSINSTNTNGKYELPDGDYSVTVTVSDAYRNSKADVVYTIDNTAPTVLLTSPNAYIEANWPEMYKLFTIKGEVYDATTISEVKVFVTDKDGKILAEKVADGTNTFLANFESPTIPTGTSCYYYAVAKDAGGNVNTYCYHKADIFELISSQKSNSSFPSINDIGYVDQGIENNFNESVTQALLSNKKLQNNKTGLSKGTYPGFDYYDKDTAQIKWLNISEDSPAGIGIGSPVLGTIMPPTDGSAIILDKVEVYLVKSADGGNTFPEFPTSNFDTWADGVTKWILEAGTAKQGDANEKQVKLSSVGDSVNFQVDSHPVGVFDNWTSSTYKIKIKFVTNSQMEGTRECAFTVTSGAPKLTEGVFAEGKGNDSYYRGFMTAKTLESGKNKLSGISKTSDGSGSVPLKYVITGAITDSQNAIVDGNGDYEIEVPIADDGSKDGEYTYTLTAEAGTLSTVISRVVVIDTLNPVVEFSNLANDDILENDEFIVKGNIDDANGISKVEYQLIENGGSAEWKEISNAKSSFNLQLSSLKENVNYTLKIRATDVGGNISGDDDYKCNFTIDLANPIATIDNPQPETGSSIYFTNEIPVFVGKASDDSKTAGKLAKTAILSYSKDGVAKGNITAGTSEGQFNWNKNEGTWTWTPTSSQFDGTGKYDVKLVVTDDSGKTTEDTLTVSLDVTPPSIKLTQVSPYVEREDVSNGDAKYYVNGDITVKFDITENDYIKSIDWYKIDGTKDSQDLGTNAQPTVKVKTTDFADGKKLSEFKLVVTDRSGNTATYTGNETELVNYEINQDSDNPTIDIAGINPEITTEAGISANNNLFSTSDSISITLKDDDGVASGTYQIDGNSEKTINGGNAKVKTETISLNGLNQGPHTIELSVRDTNGKEVSTETIYFGIDDKAPDLTIDGYSGTDIDAGFKNADFDITGTASDSYEFKQLICYVDLNTTKEITRNGTNWTLPIEKPNSSEKKTIRFVASDKFSRTTIKTFTYIFDLDKPNLIINDVQKENITDKYFNQNSILTLSGTANDLVGDTATQSGLKFVQYAIGTGHDATLANSDGWQNANGSTDWTVLLNIPKYQDGQYTLLVKAIDNSDNESEVEKFNITADSVSPILTEGGSSDASGTSYASGTLNLTGTVTEKNLNSLIYTYSLDGQEKESNEVQITSNNGDEVSWSITKSELQDGTHVFKIIATDKAGNSSVITRNIIIDETAPEITTNVSPQILYNNGNGEEPTVNGTINVNVRVAETNKIKGVYYTFDDWASQESFNETEFATGKTILVDTTKYGNKSKLPLKIKAVDEAGNYSIVEVNPVVNQESDKPSFTPSNLDDLANESAAGWTEGNPNNVFNSSNSNMIFTLSDDDSVKDYWVKIDNNEFVKVADVNSAQQIVTYSVKDIGYGRHTITFRVKDSNCKDDLSTTNNFVEKTYYFAIDDEAPNLTVKNANNQYVGDSFTISGTVTDANGIDKIEISSNENTEKIDYDGTKQTEEFSYIFNVPQIMDPEVKDIITITAYDSIGNRKEVQLTYLVDKTSPELSIQGGASAYVDADYPSLRIAGTATDGDLGGNDNGISGIDQVRLKIGSSITSVDDAESVLAVGKIENGVMTWSSSVDFTDKDAGSYSIYIQAFDHAGNVSDEETLTVYVDDDVPQLSDNYTDNFVGVYNSDFVIEGTASDASGVKSVTAKIQGASGNLNGNFTATSKDSPASWTFDIPANTGNGQLTILVTATDGCGKSVQETFTATLDTEAPSVTFTDISDDDDNNATIETSKTTDKPRVSVTYADSTSGVNSVEYTFYYYDPNGNISGLTPDADGFIDYSDVDGNASGSFTRDKSFSGTVVMRMAESTGSTGAFINTETNTDGIWYVKVTVTDEAGNSAEYDSPYFYVDQHKPVLNVISPASSVNLKKQNDALEVTGTTSDSYGGDIDKVVVKITHPSYNASEQDKFTKTFTKDGSNGTEIFTKDGVNYQFTYTWDSANSPFIYPDVYELLVSTYDVAGNETVRTPQKISCDNTAPTIIFSRPYSYSVDAFGNVNEGIIVNSPIGDTSIKALADDYSMASIYYQIGGTVDIEATGSIGSSNYKITKLTVENGGVGTDTYGTSVTDVKLDGVNIALAGNWNRLTSANLDFDVEYNTLNMVNAGKTYHAVGDKETIQTLDVHFVAVDTAGNINYCKYPLKVDTDTDKPTLLMLSPKTINDVANVGGTATISGTVNDDNAVHSVWMQVELVNGNYDGNDILSGFTALTYGITEPQVLVEDIVDGKPTYSSESTTSYFADRTKWYKVNLGAENSTSTTWNMMLNKNGEFDIAELKQSGSLPNDDELKQTELLIKVKALDTKAADGLSISTDAKAGDSTEFRLIIDSGSPSIIINNIADFPAEGSYIGGSITFDLEFSDDQSITEWKLEAISTASGDNRSMLIASDEYSGSYEDGLGKTVTPDKIIVDTADIYAQCGNLIQFKISAKDNSKDPQSQTESPKESYLTFKYTIDNSAPDASLVSTIDSKSYYIDTESVMGDLTGAHRETIARGNHLRIMSNQAAFTGKVFDEANGSGIDYVMLYFTKGNRLYNPSEVDSSFEISNHLSVKDKDGNSVSPLSPVGSLKDVVRTSGTSNPYIVVDRAEGMLDSGANGDLDGYDENLKANGDWVVYIKSSNLPDGIYDIHYVVVDFAGNARYYSDTMLVQNHAPTINSIVLATDIDGDGQASIGNDDKGDEYQKFVTGEFTSTGFNVRNSKLKIKVNVTGGTGNLKYYLRYKTKTGEITTDKNNSGYSTGIFDISDFLGDSATPVDYVVWVEDSVEQNLSLSSGETTIDMIMDNEDDVAPVAQFFELNTITEDSKTGNKDRGSLYKGNGHIEPRGNSPFGNTDGKDPDVSGTIILRGEVFDNQRINYIALNLNGIETPIAQWSENSLKVSDDEIVNIVSKLGLDGHYVEWSYAWDTNSIVAENVNISVIVKDASGKSNTESSYDNKNNSPRTTENMYSRENWGYNKMTVDVVPYITAVYRNSSYNTNRAKSGAYPMLRGQVDNCIEGFNLGTDISKISVVITENKDGSGYSFAMGNLTKSGTSTAFTVTTDSKDGYLSTVVNGIRSINNLNSNSHEYNRESNSYDSKTAYWTDDRYVRIWQNKSSDYFPGSTNPVYPAMSIGNTGDLYASFSNYSTASVYYSRYGGSGTGTVFKIYDPPEETDICVTGEDKLNIAFAGNYHNGGSNSWVSDASLSGGIYVYDSASTGKYNGYKFNKHELYYHNKMLQQFKNMRVKRKSSDRIIHLVYFDRITSSIHYSNSRGDSSRSSDSTKQTSTSAEYSWVNIDGGTDGDDYAYYFDGNSTYIEDSKGTYDRFEDTERCAGTGESAGLALTKSGYPVVVYFDASNKVLKLARALRENPKNSDTTWWVQDIKEAKDFLGVSVEAISCEIDSSGYLHIAFQNGKNQLIYIKSTNTSDNGSTRYTFTTPVIVAEGVSWVDLTLYGSTPYISFLSGANSYDGLNLAFFDKNIDTNFDGISDGTWECMVAPLAYKATSIRTCVEVHPQMTTSDWEAAIGFTPGDLYRVALYIGSGKGH